MNYSIKIASRKRSIVEIDAFQIAPNKINFLFGESGIGKSIISKAIYGLLDPDELDIRINAKSYHEYCKSAPVVNLQKNGFFVFQEPSTHLNPLLTLNAQLNEGSLKEVGHRDESEIIENLWKETPGGYPEQLLKVYPQPHRPSGGEKQRIMLAMAFKKLKKYLQSKTVQQTGLFIFDEPTGSLDNTYRNVFLDLLMDYYGQKPFTALVITHDYSIISHMENRHKTLAPALEYLELAENQGKQHLSSFSKEHYLNWVDKQQTTTSDAIHAGHVAVEMHRGLQVFNKPLSFFKKDGAETNLQIKRGELVYLKAQSGAGKTTVAKIIMGLIQAQKVTLFFDQAAVTQKTPTEFWRKHIWGKRASMVFQHADEALNQAATVLEIFKALSANRKVDKVKVLRRIQELFDVPLGPEFLDKKIGLLSGGQKQRINILRTLVLDTDILIFDEPLNGLDLKSAQKVIEKIKQRQADGKAILLISHNEEIFDRIAKAENTVYLKS